MKKSLILALTSIGAMCIIYSCIKDRDNIARSEEPYSDMTNSQGNVELEAKIVSEMYYEYIYKKINKDCYDSALQLIDKDNTALYKQQKISEWILSLLSGKILDTAGLNHFTKILTTNQGAGYTELTTNNDYKYPILEHIILTDTLSRKCFLNRLK